LRRSPVAALFLAAIALWTGRLEGATGAAPRPEKGALPGFRLIDATAASVNGEIIFLSDVEREACFERCDAFPGEKPDNVSMSEARRKLIYNRLILQEQRKLALGTVDNAVLAAEAAGVRARMANCSYPCAIGIEDNDIRAAVSDRALVSGFLQQRVAVFIEIPEEEVQLEIGRRAAAEGKDPADYSEDAVRSALRDEKSKLEVRNWYYKAASNARIFLSPMEEK
jgi:hypothetical protein